ncbi:MAG: 30S ribosomal protein S17 [Elusimicrobiota bacterium]|jgi:small subunit ribosomal protein S17|nr:30S ribosomal protein S17 [Elusimicrobiota bacterium]
MEKTNNRAERKVLSGVVVSDKMNKTRTVEVPTRKKHPFYGKIVTTSKCYHAHDEGNESKIGDRVEITSTRPLSKLKRWRVSKITEKALS